MSKGNISRPINWSKLSPQDTENVVRARALDSKSLIITKHALERMEEISITILDLFRILRTGTVADRPIINSNGDWEIIITKNIEGREAGAAGIVFTANKIFIKTVMWRDRP